MPAATENGGTSDVTTDPHATIDPLPTVTPLRMIELKPIHTLL